MDHLGFTSFRADPDVWMRAATKPDGEEYFDRGSIPAKVRFWVGLRIFFNVPTPTEVTNAISQTQLSGPKKGAFSPKIPRRCPFFVFGVF